MKEFRDAIHDILLTPTENFAVYLAALDPPKTCKILEHGLDVVSKSKSSDFPHLVLDPGPNRVTRSIAGHPAKGQLRKGRLNILIAVRRDEQTYAGYNEAQQAAEGLMVDVVMYLETKFNLISEAGFADMRYREGEDNWFTYLTQVAGVECVVGRLAFEAEYEWSQNRVLTNKAPSRR